MALHFCSDVDLSQYFWPLFYLLVQVLYWDLLISSPKEFSISPFPQLLQFFCELRDGQIWAGLLKRLSDCSLYNPHINRKGEKITMWELWVVLFLGKMRTVAWETASQRGLRNYFKLLQRDRGKGQYTCDFGEGGVHSVRYTFLQKFSAGLVKVTASYEERMSTLMFLVLF